MFGKTAILTTIAVSSILFLTGCETIRKALDGDSVGRDYQPRYVMSFHQTVRYPRAHSLEQRITTFDGRNIWINTNHFVHSRNIEEVNLIPRPGEDGFYDLDLKLDRPGAMQWMQVSVQFRDRPLVILLDGRYYREFMPGRVTHEDDVWVKLRGPFDKVTAEGIKKYAPTNYRFFNPPTAALW